MNILASGVLVAGEAGTSRACYTFPSVLQLASGTLLATARHGSGKDGDDDAIAVFADHGDGGGWVVYSPLPPAPELDGRKGSLKLAYLTELRPGILLAAAMWVDRSTYPGKPLFDPVTEGCLPMAILLSRSDDNGQSWSAWRHIELPEALGPPSLTSPLVLLGDGRLAMSIESNKHYEDSGVWHQQAVLLLSADDGVTWQPPHIAASDPTGRIFNWDLRVAAAPDGRLVSFAWTFDRQANVYRNIHRRISADAGISWSAPEDIGVADQAARPAILPDGRLVLAWVDRFGSRAIHARMAERIDAPFPPETDLTLYQHVVPIDAGGSTLGAALADMEMWSFGLPSATALSNGDVLLVYYAGTAQQLDIRWARLRP
jgi:hypothetical protein